MRPPGLLITGTDTEVGKTWITALIARDMKRRGVRVGVYKPLCSGSETDANGNTIWPDLQTLSDAVDHEFSIDWICPQRFHAPLAPPVAARMEHRAIDATQLRTAHDVWYDHVDLLLVEGVGGLLCPLTDEETVADLAADLEHPLLIVARAGLGTINHTLMTIEVARHRGLRVIGVVLNQTAPTADQASVTNPDEISRRTDVPVLACVNYNDTSIVSRRDNQPLDWPGLLRCAGNNSD